MAAYAQTGAKRQKVKERFDNVDYFQGIDKVEYSRAGGAGDAGVFRYYSAAERLQGRTMEDWLKLCLSYTHFRWGGSDPYRQHGSPSGRPWDDGTNSLENNKRCLKAFFDLMSKLGIKYWTAFDADLVPLTDNWEEYKSNWEEMAECVSEWQQRSAARLLCLAPALHSRARYASGSFTNPDASTFAQAAAQIKKCLEMSQRLNAECFLLWPCREGYSSIFQTDVAREIKLFAKLLKMTAEYKERLNYRCQLLIMPYNTNNTDYRHSYKSINMSPCEWASDDVIHTYMWDVTSCLYLLKSWNLERYYKVCCPPGHHMFMAHAYNMLGGVTLPYNSEHCYDNRTLTTMMKCIVDQGSAPIAGITLQVCPPRACEPRDVMTSFVRRGDVIARALRVACTLHADQVFAKCLQQRYASYHSGFGSRLATADVSLEDCEEYHKKNQSSEPVSHRSQHYELMFQRHVDATDHI